MTDIAIFLATSGHSGVDRAARHLIPELVERGYRVDLLKVRRHGPDIRLHHPGYRCIDLGSRHVYPSLPALVRYLRRNHPKVLLADKDRVNRTALLARAFAGYRPRLVLSSGTTISIDLAHRGRFERWLQRTSMGRLYPIADQVIVTSQGVAEDLTAYTGLPSTHIRVVPSPVVPDAFFEQHPPAPDHPWFARGQPPVVLGTGALTPRKGFDTLVDAFARLRRQRPARLVILGHGALKEALRNQADRLGVAEDVDFPGFAKDPYSYMAHAQVFALTSRWEGLGFVLIEALAMGTPVVATDCPSGPREILDNGRFGRLVPVGDSESLCEALATTLDRPLEPGFLQQAARRYAVSAATDAYLGVFGLPRQRPQDSA